MTDTVYFTRYRDLIPEWETFQDFVSRPRPETLRVNRLKTNADELRAYFERREIRVQPSEWFENLLYWRQSNRAGSATLAHWSGRYYLQDPVTLLPVEALDLRPGEVALDLCAAPGGKALYMAEEVGSPGSVIANEPAFDRRRALGSNIRRLGAWNLAVTGYDGQSVPEKRQFSAILVDAPCSGEGANRGGQHRSRSEDEKDQEQFVGVQWMLLEKAYTLLEPGGRLVYATCSYAPEENEAVVARLLADTDARLEPWEDGRPHAPGVEKWEDEKYPSVMSHLWRCYPYHYDGGGIVFGKIRKPGVSSP